ncbi:dephospho-CoA kinase [Mariniblastus fucicola]|uniref:Dephospho-CoA kinase n=2 Tax=Mariniblastus fucicola TaxID=980251 RepID=A0A5B9PPV4_9BACT|nr:dephospho-CoA kinase [Mariniblastus fucicola]QEG24511.1 Dephospho-CoA kinase [Mariniblastus fucicola]
MVVVGLNGGVASGKSFVSSCFEELGAHRIDADQVAHEVLQNADVIDRIVDHFGDDVIQGDGQIDRKRLGKIVFGGTGDAELDHLESIVHPEIRIRIRSQMELLRKSADVELLVLDIPLLFEGEYDQHCDYVIFVDANLNVRQQRAKLRGWSDDELEKRESRQLSVEEKKLRSDVVINNSGSKESTARQLAEFCQKLGLEVPASYRALYRISSNDTLSNTDPPNGCR